MHMRAHAHTHSFLTRRMSMGKVPLINKQAILNNGIHRKQRKSLPYFVQHFLGIKIPDKFSEKNTESILHSKSTEEF